MPGESLRTGCDIERGGMHGGRGERGVFRHDATRKNDRNFRMPRLEIQRGIPIEGLAGAAIDAGRVRIEQDGVGSEIRRTAEVVDRLHADGFEKRHAGILIDRGILRRLVAVKLDDIEQPVANQSQGKLRRPRSRTHRRAESVPQDRAAMPAFSGAR